LGCGPRDQADPLQFAGYQYIGVDYSSQSADFLADAHALPFRDEVFDCVFPIAVLEYLHSPFVAAKEIEQILRPGGIFIGTVSQGEPFHSSYFHHTPWGLVSLAESSKAMQLSRLWCGPGTLRSLATMGQVSKDRQNVTGFGQSDRHKNALAGAAPA
jgi:SAM-dependent methyltransferase